MAAVVAPPPARAATGKYPNFAAVLERIGDVPAERILTYPAPGTATEADLLDPAIVGDRAVELVDGILVEKAMGAKSEYQAVLVLGMILDFLKAHNLGAVFGGQGPFRFTGLVRKPDVSFVRWDSVKDTDDLEDPDGAYIDYPPDLAVEVMSPGNSPKEMAIKLGEYAKAGVKLVWYVYPETKEVVVYPKAKERGKKVVGPEGVLDGGTVLPGFALPVAKIFEKRAPAGSKGTKKGLRGKG